MSARIKRSQLHDDRDYPALRELSRGARCIYDIGGLYGVTALLMAKTAVDSQVWSFDASERSCELISINAALNGVSDRVHTVSAVLSDRTGDVIPFFSDALLSGVGSIVAGYLGQENAINRVTLSTDDFAAQSGTHPDFIKMLEQHRKQHMDTADKTLVELSQLVKDLNKILDAIRPW